MARKTASKKATDTSATEKRTSAKKAGAQKSKWKMSGARKPAKRSKEASSAKTNRRTQPEKDPKGGLTPAGREAYRRKEGAHLRPGVGGKADTPEKKRRKGSFLRRHFAHPRGPMEKHGTPTRLALSAHAWGEPVPKTSAAAKKLASKGKHLLEQYKKFKNKHSR